MKLDVVAINYENAKKLGNRNQDGYEEMMKICFCETFIEELKKVKGSDLAPHYKESIYIVDEGKTRVTFEF